MLTSIEKLLKRREEIIAIYNLCINIHDNLIYDIEKVEYNELVYLKLLLYELSENLTYSREVSWDEWIWIKEEIKKLFKNWERNFCALINDEYRHIHKVRIMLNYNVCTEICELKDKIWQQLIFYKWFIEFFGLSKHWVDDEPLLKWLYKLRKMQMRLIFYDGVTRWFFYWKEYETTEYKLEKAIEGYNWLHNDLIATLHTEVEFDAYDVSMMETIKGFNERFTVDMNNKESRDRVIKLKREAFERIRYVLFNV